jgi:glycosyltransferase involved in cell wall biosynthesis
MEFLPKTQESLRAQTYKDVDIVILDNGSNAEAQAFVDAWASSDDKVRVVRSNPRVPMLDNFNLGIRAARTKYVTFFHDDDEYREDFIEKLVGLLEAHPSAGLAGSNYDFIDETGQVTDRRRWLSRDGVLTRREYVSALVGRGRNLIPMPGLVYRRDILGNGFDTSLPIHFGDFILLLRYAEQADIAVTTEAVVRVRRHVAQASNQIPLSRAIPLRTELLLDYLVGYEERFPEDGEMSKRLRRRIELTRRVGLVWGWASATNEAERGACVGAFEDKAVDKLFAASLRGASALGLRPEKLVGRAMKIVQRVAETLRF